MSLFISNAHASAGAPAAGGGMEMLIMLAIFGLVFYFLIYRPQAKRCLLYTSPSPRDRQKSRMPSSA